MALQLHRESVGATAEATMTADGSAPRRRPPRPRGGVRVFRLAAVPLALLVAVGLWVACDVSNPVAPADSQGPPGNGGGAARFTITLRFFQVQVQVCQSDPSEDTEITGEVRVVQGSPVGVCIRVTVSNAAREIPDQGTQITLSADLGFFDSFQFQSNTATKGLDAKGQAGAQYFPGDTVGPANLVVTLGSGAAEPKRVVIQIVPPEEPPDPPVADFSFEPSQANPLRILFQDSSTGTIDKRVWDFGHPDGAGCSADDPCGACGSCEFTGGKKTDPIHTFPAIDTYLVRLTVTNTADDLSDKAEFVAVGEPPPAPQAPKAKFSSKPGKTSLSVIFTDESTGPPTSWDWDFGDNKGTSSQQNPNYEYAEKGEYLVTLTVNNSIGPANTTSDFITVGADIADLTADFEADTEEGSLIVVFTDKTKGATGQLDHLWDFGCGGSAPNCDPKTSKEKNPVHTYRFSGQYVVKLTVTDRVANSIVGRDDVSKRVTVDSKDKVPVADFSFLKIGGRTVDFTDESTESPRTWLWDFDDGGATSTEQNPVHTFGTGKVSFAVKLTVSNGAGVDSTAKTVSLDELVADFGFAQNGKKIEFTDQSAGDPCGWNWDFGDTKTSTDQNPVHPYDAAGDYDVTLTVTGEGPSGACDGDTDSVTKRVTVLP